MGVRDAVGEYMDYSTIHGIGRAKNSPFIILKIFWVLAVCASLGIIFWQVYELNEKYQSSPVSTSIEVKTSTSLPYPSISICNTNPALFSKLNPSSPMYQLLDLESKKYAGNLTLFNAVDDYYNYTYSDNSPGGTVIDDDILTATANKFKMLLSISTDEELEDMSQKISDFIIMCNFYGQKCQPNMFLPLRTYDYGMCYSFRPDRDPRLKDGYTSVSGTDYSLELLLFVNQNDALPFVSSSTGILIQPDIGGGLFNEEKSVFIPTGFEANIGLEHVEYASVPGTQRPKRCSDDSNENLSDCTIYCTQRYIYEICGCYQYFFLYGEVNSSIPLNQTFDPVYGYRPCHSEKDYECVTAAKDAFISEHKRDCAGCLPLCHRTEYRKDSSMFTWPNEKFIPVLRRIMEAKAPDIVQGESITRDFVRNNLALVRVYLSSLTYETVKEEYSYSDVDFVSDVGGQLGLWAGFSVLSLLEIVELVVILIARSRKKESNTKVEDISVDEKPMEAV